jgi:PilZ domain-containing protein
MQERRQVPRYQLASEAKLIVPASGNILPVSVKVISTRGCALVGEALPAEGVKCELQLDWHASGIRLPAKVLWKNTDGRTGLEFLDVPENQLMLLRELCASLWLQPIVPLRPDKS